MDVQEVFDAIRLIVALEILGYASMLDWRTRRVPNKFWASMSLIGVALLLLQIALEHWPVEYMLVSVPVFAVLSDVYLDVAEGTPGAKALPTVKYAVAIASIVALAFVLWDEEDARHILAVPAMMLVIVAFYMLDIIKGGADAKALIALCILFPFYPALGGLPLGGVAASYSYLMPFTLTVLVTAAIVVAVLPVSFLIRNLANRDLRFPQALFGYRLPADRIVGKHVWLMERVEDGKHILYARPKPDEDLKKEVDQLVSCGHNRLWVTPKIPFIVPITVALAISASLGSVLFLLFPV